MDALGAGLPEVIRTWMGRHWSMTGWQWLPIGTLVGKREFSTAALIEQMPSVPVRVFQGTADELTPYALVQSLPSGHSNVCLTPVAGAVHENAYILARDAYIENLRSMLGANR
ncbi:hypothetical protein GCM10007863_38240 [Dyella mobilis]|nr:hypothetical protein GCM10007863_38240 [Dyella mobilis]